MGRHASSDDDGCDTLPVMGDGDDRESRYERDLGVVEAITQVTRSCPNGTVVAAAERALEAIKAGGSDVLRTQAYFVLIAIKGWRGGRAEQVHRSLSRFLERPGGGTTSTDTPPSTSSSTASSTPSSTTPSSSTPSSTPSTTSPSTARS